MKIIKKRELVEIKEYQINFFFKDNNEICLGFACNKDGEEIKERNTPEAYKNYLEGLNNPNLYHQLICRVRHYTENAIGKCECGEEVELYPQYMGACSCPKCKRWYNTFGQELNPPETWKDGDDW